MIFMEIGEVLRSAEYLGAKSRIEKFRGRVEMMEQEDDLLEVYEEIEGFFSSMQEGSPFMYSLFEIDEKELVGLIRQKLTGEDVIVD